MNSRIARPHQFPLAFADRVPSIGASPEHHVVRTATLFTFEKGRQVNTIECKLIAIATRLVNKRGYEIHRHDWLVVDTRRNPRHFNDHRDADAAFPHAALVPPKREVVVR